MLNHRAPANLRDDDLNLVLMVAMKVYLNQAVLGDPKSRLNQDEMIQVVKKVGRKMGGRNYSVYLNYRDVLPCAHSRITNEI
jgi:hypothetical protein